MTNPAPARPSTLPAHTGKGTRPPLVIAESTGIAANGKHTIKSLGLGHRNNPGNRPGFTCRLKKFPSGGALIAFNPDHTPFPDTAPTTMRVYAVTGKRPAYSRSRFEWKPYGQATLRPDRLGYEITLDAIPPLDDEGHVVFSMLERQIGDVDHQDTVIANNLFLKALEQDLTA